MILFSCFIFAGKLDLPIHVVLAELRRRFEWPAAQVGELQAFLLENNLTSAQLLRNYWLKPPMKEETVPKEFRQPFENFLGIGHAATVNA